MITSSVNVKVLLPLQPNSSAIICGASNSGKSQFTKKLIENLGQMYESDPPVRVLYCYGVHQILYTDMEALVPNIQFHEGLPNEKLFDEYADGKHTLIVLDDLMNSVACFSH